VIGASVLATCAAAVPALAANGGMRGTDAQNHQAAIQDAGALLTRVQVPESAAPSSQEPSGDGGVLAHPALTDGAQNLVDRYAWWTVSESMAEVLKYEQSNPPPGGRLEASCGGGGSDQPQWRCLAFVFSPRHDVLGVRELVVEMVGLADGSTGVRADAEVQWLINRPANEKVPAGVRAIQIRRGPPGHTISEKVTDPSTVRKIIRLFDALPVLQPGFWGCPRESGPAVRFGFRDTPDGPNVASASVLAGVGGTNTGCDAMSFTIGGRRQPALVRARHFLRAVGHLLGVKLTQPHQHH
jgi:hypothetical protein